MDIEQAEKDAPKLLKQESYMAHIHAMYLLAQFRETRAYQSLRTGPQFWSFYALFSLLALLRLAASD